MIFFSERERGKFNTAGWGECADANTLFMFSSLFIHFLCFRVLSCGGWERKIAENPFKCLPVLVFFLLLASADTFADVLTAEAVVAVAVACFAEELWDRLVGFLEDSGEVRGDA
jgi:hypothetical protein